jgi:hypothetical protein
MLAARKTMLNFGMNIIPARPGLLLALFLTTAFATSLNADEEPPFQNPALKRLYSELRTLFQQHYPKVTSHLLKNSIHFEHDTRAFIVHEPTKNGDWQDPWETRGPKRGGILCDLELIKGKYEGAAVVPQTFDKRYFKVLLTAPYSSRHAAHLYIHLSYPADAKAEFLKQFTELVNDFGSYLD